MTNPNECEYLDMLGEILNMGERMEQRAILATGQRPYCLSIFGYQIRMDLSKGFPLLTTKKMSIKAVLAELLWFIKGSTNAKTLADMGARIWDQWADETGELGPVYGKHWRRWGEQTLNYSQPIGTIKLPGLDQLKGIELGIKAVIADPNHSVGRRLVMINYNPAEIPPKAPPGCHTLVQFSARKGRLDCHFYMRSADSFLGVPYNIASYAALTHILANIADLKPGFLITSFGDVHIYSNHIGQVHDQLGRVTYSPPTFHIGRKLASVDDVKMEDFELRDYQSHPALKGEVAI